MTFAKNAIKYYLGLASEQVEIPEGYRVINPYTGDNREQIEKVLKGFYTKFYNDKNQRRLIWGSSPARRGTALIGVPFEEAAHLEQITGIKLEGFHISKASSGFLQDVIELYGGYEVFYKHFYMSFICPFGISKVTPKGTETNCNYYENKILCDSVYDLIVKTIKNQLKFGIDTSVCYCIGSGENYKFLTKINKKYQFFNTIIALEHPRFIMQYNSRNKNTYIKKYLDALNI